MLRNKQDLTFLNANQTTEEFDNFIAKAIEYKPYAVCVLPEYAFQAFSRIGKKGIKICTVIAFPSGRQSIAIKQAEVNLVRDYVDEIDYVVNRSFIFERKSLKLQCEARYLKDAIGQGKIVKAIIETSDLTADDLCFVVEALKKEADYIKTSTGTTKEGANKFCIGAIKNLLKDSGCKIKASGGIKTSEQALDLISVGADRIGSSTFFAEV